MSLHFIIHPRHYLDHALRVITAINNPVVLGTKKARGTDSYVQSPQRLPACDISGGLPVPRAETLMFLAAATLK